MFLSFFYDMNACPISASCFSEKSAAGFDLSGVIASEANFSKGDFKEVVMSKSYARVSRGNSLAGSFNVILVARKTCTSYTYS